MHKVKYFFITLAILLATATSVNAVVNFSRDNKHLTLTYTTFMDYPPFGNYHVKYEKYGGKTEKFETIFTKFAKKFFNDSDIEYQIIRDENYTNLVRRVRAGGADIIFGAYYNTKQYDGLDLVMPAMFDNPVVLIMLPKNVSKVKSLNDLKKLKGATFSKDKFNDFVHSEIKKFNVTEETDSLEIFRKLFVEEIDYIFASYYFGVGESAKFGLRSRLSISKQAIWNMPMFIAVSKISPHHQSIIQTMMNFITKEENRKIITDELARKIREYEQQSQKITPPIFTK